MNGAWFSLTVLLAAVMVDALLGEPPEKFHPVVWMGVCVRKGLGFSLASTDAKPRQQLFIGALLAVFVPTIFGAGAAGMLALAQVHAMVKFALAAWLLKSTFALGALRAAGEKVREALVRGELSQARRALSSLCSRNADDLAPNLLVAATVESLAENASDSFVAPVFFYLVAGVPGAVFYRAVNTLDSMIGYHGRYEYLGKASARLDDLLNWIPARATALLLLLAGMILGWEGAKGTHILRRDHAKTESPNAGWPMAAMAGLLGVQLEKCGHYCLGDAIRPLDPATIDQAWRVVSVASGLLLILIAMLVCGGVN